jgi:hypothetical protein
MYAYYCFEYKWNFFAVSLNERLDFFESNWAFFAGFGMLIIIHCIWCKIYAFAFLGHDALPVSALDCNAK